MCVYGRYQGEAQFHCGVLHFLLRYYDCNDSIAKFARDLSSQGTHLVELCLADSRGVRSKTRGSRRVQELPWQSFG